MDGFYELGMHRRTLAVARRILQREHLTAEAFERSLVPVLTCASSVKPWIATVETAWNRLTSRGQRRARPEMLAFHYSADTLDRALPFATVHPRHAFDFTFSLATFTHHRKESEAKRLVDLGLSNLGAMQTPFEQGMICRAIAHHCLERKQWGQALHAWSHAPADLALVEEQHLDMAVALRGLAEEAMGRLDQLVTPEHAVSHPGLDDKLISDARRRLGRLRRSLAWTEAKKDR
jgi:hypothetical protein